MEIKILQARDCGFCNVRRKVARINIHQLAYYRATLQICAQCTLEVLIELLTGDLHRKPKTKEAK